ncbi:Spo11/DNA topoisomerase VI subunit A [Phytophthora cactorum]|nr:Spo11/DNA topoisomerase VI subunit A [Phytophthora cactorum]
MVPSILITGRGFPDLATRYALHTRHEYRYIFVSLLSNALGIPVLGLCDCNPFGLSIMWVGVRPSQVAGLGLPTSSFKALTRKDLAVADSLMRAGFIQYAMNRANFIAVTQANEHFKDEVQMWLGDALPWKIELEALHFLGFTFLTSFLQDCIEEGNYL